MNKTERGFRINEFEDLYGAKCSIQESSLATDSAIWLGCNEGTHVNDICLGRMHLNQEQVIELIPLLQYFVEHGQLPDDTVSS